jgi:hypothetical protein
MNFIVGLKKTSAAEVNVGRVLKSIATGANQIGSGFLQGLRSSGKETIGDTLKLKGIGHIGDIAKTHGNYKNALKTEQGRRSIGKAIGKASPSLTTAGAYALSTKKVYDYLTRPKQEPYYY